jgi:hypothetical protein
MIDDLLDDRLCTHGAVAVAVAAAAVGVVNVFAASQSFVVDTAAGCHDHYGDHRRLCCHSEKQNVAEIDVGLGENEGSRQLGEGDSFREVLPATGYIRAAIYFRFEIRWTKVCRACCCCCC